jgi:hypothetical protein
VLDCGASRIELARSTGLAGATDSGDVAWSVANPTYAPLVADFDLAERKRIGQRNQWIKSTTIGCVALLALIASTVSYLHMHTLVMTSCDQESNHTDAAYERSTSRVEARQPESKPYENQQIYSDAQYILTDTVTFLTLWYWALDLYSNPAAANRSEVKGA